MDQTNNRIAEAYNATRTKNVRSATLERLRITWDAHALVEGMPQQLQLGEGYYHILDHISLPVSTDDLILGRIAEEVPDREGEALLERTAREWRRAIPDWMPDGGHECFAWERLLELGLPGLEDLARSELDRRIDLGESGEHLNFLRGAVRIYQAVRNYARRYSQAASGVNGQGKLAKNCAAIAEGPPESFAEALQLVWLVGFTYCTMGAVNATLTFGRMDELLLDFYRADVELGRITRDEAGDMIEDFYCKNNLILGRGEHQMSQCADNDTGWLRNPSYDSPQYVAIGGRFRSGLSGFNELTPLFIERIVPEFENPVMIFRHTVGTPDYLWSMICDKMRDNASVMIYNDEAVIPAMIHSGIERQDAVTYTMYGCNWPTIPGIERGHGGCGVILPSLVLESIASGDEPVSMDEVYDRFAKSVKAETEVRFQRFRKERTKWLESGPGALRIDDCFQEGPVAHARSWRLGSVRYPSFLCTAKHIGTAADCMAAVDYLVFASKKVTMGDLRSALADNFRGHESLRHMCLSAPKFGQDDDLADGHARRILDTVTEVLDVASRRGSPDEIVVFRSLTTDMSHIRTGENLGATPDGRLAGRPVSDNSSPYPGSCTKGATAMFRSLSKLPFKRFNSGALNVRLQRGMVAGDEGLHRLAALLRTYFTMGGLQVQLSIADTDELRHAQLYPEAHRDLMVRITGYSAIFVDMCRSAQDEIIRRQAMGNN